GTLSLLAIMSPYRLKRLAGFINPFDDALDSGFQLTQALIAFGRGEWLGVGLGEGVQKLFYLPESHTDFVLAVLAEELGLVGVTLIIVLFLLLSLRCMQIGKRAEQNGNIFGAYIGYGVGLWIALQSFVNMGVNMGMLPTKGITLPLISYGGSSLVVSIVALALVMRVHKETTKLVNADLSPGVS
ncbi:MAG: FtsW/RodA/SpoVE family cell cycle protein, partial [Gammaproteobacteria bacterium]|nr:FtsW/RodA/SpoVE family cell cycle protein [Gammaproteobacteria bacterium]